MNLFPDHLCRLQVIFKRPDVTIPLQSLFHKASGVTIYRAHECLELKTDLT